MIITTRLNIPPERPKSLPRLALMRRLNRGLNGRLTLLNAPAGYGKTALAAAWCRHVDRPAAWLTLDPGDGDLVTFLRYTVAAIRQTDADFGRATLALLATGQPLPPPALVAPLLNELAARQAPLLLVLDDYHHVTATAVHDALAFLLDHLPPGIHIVLTTRQAPPLPLGRLRARGQLNEVGAADLRFDPEESHRFLTGTLGRDLSRADAAALAERAEGWAAGLQLAALALRPGAGVPAFLAHFSGRQQHLAGYLFEEVFAGQPPERQRFLRQTAVLSRLSAPLCDAVTSDGNGRALLDALHRDNLFLMPLDAGGKWYRYHSLFADFLRGLGPPEGDPALYHRRAARWLLENDDSDGAWPHAVAAADPGLAAAILGATADTLWMQGALGTLQARLDALPAGAVKADPRLAVWPAWIGFFRQDWAVVEAALAASEEVVAEAHVVARGMMATVRGAVAAAQGDAAAAVRHGRAARALLPVTNLPWRSVVAISLATGYRQGGEVIAARHAFAEAAALARQAGNLSGALWALTNEAELAAAAGDTSAAEKGYRRARRLAVEEGAGSLPVVGPVLVGLGLLLAGDGRCQEALGPLLEGVALNEQGGFPTADAAKALADCHEALGNPADAEAWRARAAGAATPTYGAPPSDAPPPPLEPLSPREKEVLQLMVAGLDNQAIADELVVAQSTVKWHINNIFGKLGVSSRREAVLWGVRGRE